MEKIGIICEYNPFHNGHIYHIEKIKKRYPDSLIVLVMSGNFVQRGEASMINKWDKTMIALNHGIDLVVELPFVFATQSADIFAHGAIQILNYLDVDRLVFGSECGDVNFLKEMALIQLKNENYNCLVKKYMKEGNNYPTAMSLSLCDLGGKKVVNPNDVLGLCYIKEIMLSNSNMKVSTIKRTSNYHSNDLTKICSASAIRMAIKEGNDVSYCLPSDSLDVINKIFIDDYFYFLKYKIITDDLTRYATLDDGIIRRIKKAIFSANNLDELIDKVKTKRYTYNRIKRMFLHILCSLTKEDVVRCQNIHYIRVLGFNKLGKSYLNSIKHSCELPIISNFSAIKDVMLDIEFRSTCVYALLFDNLNSIIESEYKNKPVMVERG